MNILPEHIRLDENGTPQISGAGGVEMHRITDQRITSGEMFAATTNQSCNNTSSCGNKDNSGCTNHNDCSGGVNTLSCTNWTSCYRQPDNPAS